MWVTLCGTAEVPDEDVLEVVLDGHVYCAYRIAGRHYVTDGICTHAVARLAEGFVLDDIIECPPVPHPDRARRRAAGLRAASHVSRARRRRGAAGRAVGLSRSAGARRR
jgi:hypothetical protein